MDCVEDAPDILGNAFHAVGPGRPGCRLGKAGVRQSWETFNVVTYRTEPWARRMSTLQHNYLMGKMRGKWNLPPRILWEPLLMHVKHAAVPGGKWRFCCWSDWSSLVILSVHLHVWESEVSSNKIHDWFLLFSRQVVPFLHVWTMKGYPDVGDPCISCVARRAAGKKSGELENTPPSASEISRFPEIYLHRMMLCFIPWVGVDRLSSLIHSFRNYLLSPTVCRFLWKTQAW